MLTDNLKIPFDKALEARGSDDFKAIVQHEIEQLDPSLLPLQQGLSKGSYVVEEPFKAIIINVAENNNIIVVKAGIFYQSIIAGCNCADDPTPVDTEEEYCVLQFDINRDTGETSVQLLEE